MESVKDGRWPKQLGDFGEQLVMQILIKKEMSVALIDHVGADVIAADLTNPSKRPIAISVKSRQFYKDSDSYNFTNEDQIKLIKTAENFHMEPYVAFVFSVKEDKTKTHVIIGSLNNFKKMAENADKYPFLNKREDGLHIRLTPSMGYIEKIASCDLLDYNCYQSVTNNIAPLL
jgi:Holliday junction resolvase-like predicted endonuclease